MKKATTSLRSTYFDSRHLCFSQVMANRSMSSQQQPLVISGNSWKGDDGNWSTIPIQVGSSQTELQVLISISQSDTFLPWTENCAQSKIMNCSTRTFEKSNSTSWNSSLSGDHGWDTINLSFVGGPALDQQPISGTNSTSQFLGSIGLAAKLSSVEKFEFTGTNASNSSILQTLKTDGIIPSLSLGYYAGASYRNKAMSLVLGGYDNSAFNLPVLSQDLSQNMAKLLTIPLNSIIINSPTDTPLSKKAISPTVSIEATIDSTSPHLVLPSSICTEISSHFDLSLDPISGLYLINDTHHSALQKSNKSLIFTFSNTTDEVNITLPYPSLDLTASPPFQAAKTRYFPLRISDNDSTAILGRVFMQETYLALDFERAKFYIAQALSTAQPPEIIPINPIDPPKVKSGNLLGLFIIVALVVFGIGLCIPCCYVDSRRRRRNKELMKIWKDAHTLKRQSE